MNKKSFLIVLTFVFLLVLLNNVFAKDVAYVVKSAQNPQIISILNEMNYSYDVILDTNIANANFSNYAVLLIQDSITNKDYLPLSSKNLIFINKDYAPLVWTSGTLITGSSNIFSAKLDQIGTPFTQGLTSINFHAYTTAKPEYYLHVYPAGITSVARTTGSTGSYPIVAYSNSNNNRKVFFGFYSIDYWSQDTKTLFKNSLNWTRQGVDNDNDGYYSDNDCNDNDVTKWHNLQGYLDNDRDGKGTGSIIQVCSGASLPLGYSNITGDCNDADATKWRTLPGYLDSDRDEIGTGNVIQICSGNNLPLGYSTTGGDCNDTNAILWVSLNGYLDSDLDGRGSGDIIKVCSNGSLPVGYSNFGTDCNDSDGSVWRLILGYVDDDFDEFGIGNNSDVCSGYNLPPGFSMNHGDCDDNDSSISPDAVEIPYDDIDQTCKGYDTGDADNDGYCNFGYVIKESSLQCAKETGLIGTDCNDNDVTYNLESTNQLKDCKNDAPVLVNINNLRLMETEIAVLNISAMDPDNDNLTYFVDQSNFEQNETNQNIFSWQTNYLDLGNYSIEVIVSDGELNDSQIFNFEIVKTNRRPICNEIPFIESQEDEIVQIDLNDYCFDDDGDDLTFRLVNASSELNLDSVIDGIASISSANDYSGEEWIIFSANDGLGSTETNRIPIRVNPINDAPVLMRDIDAVSFDEGNNAVNVINLMDHLMDIDSNLSFNVTGNYFVDVRINDGKVSFYPEEGFFGTETVVFSASDEEFTVYSNPVRINVNDINAAPVFNELNCPLNINEDTEYQCELSATDPENDSFSFSVVSNARVNCTIEGNVLKYISEKDQIGKGICEIGVRDIRGSHGEKIIEFNIENVNDAPFIRDYYPREDSIKLLTNTEKRFVVFASDSDSQTNITWKVGDEFVGNLSSYNFIRNNGSYFITAIVSDGEYSFNHSWNVLVGNMNQFTCGEMNGHTCNENQTCSGQILDVSDTTSCCTVSCTAKPPEFKSIKNVTIENRTDNIKIDIYEPSGETVYLGDVINSTIHIENDGTDMDFDVQVYIYDMTKGRVIEKMSKSATISQDSGKSLDFSFQLEDDLKDENKYYIFVRATGKDDNKNRFYNELYEELKLSRKDSDLVIKEITINPESGVVCGDEIDATVVVENLGKVAQYITVKVENTDLKWNLISDSFRVGEYGEEDSKKTIFLQVPADAKEGTYKIKASFNNYNTNQFVEKEIQIGACKNQLNMQKTLETIRINPGNEELVSTPAGEDSNLLFIIVGLISVIMMAVILVVLSVYIKNVDFMGADNSNLFSSKPPEKIGLIKKIKSMKTVPDRTPLVNKQDDLIMVYPKEQRIVVTTKTKKAKR